MSLQAMAVEDRLQTALEKEQLKGLRLGALVRMVTMAVMIGGRIMRVFFLGGNMAARANAHERTRTVYLVETDQFTVRSIAQVTKLL